MILVIFWIILSLALSAFFSGSEMAYVSANKLGVEVMRNKGNKGGKYITHFYENPKQFLGAMLVGNNIALVIFTMFMTDLIEPYLTPYLGEGSIPLLLIVTILITIVVLIFGEFLPKTFFRLYANEMIFRLRKPLRFFMWILSIPVLLMTTLSNFLLKNIFKAPIEEVEEVFTKTDLEHYINDTINEEEDIDKEILTNALNLNQVRARDCMVPRTEIVFLEKNATIDELIEQFKASHLSRIMIADGDIENIIGYVHHQYLLDRPQTLKKIIKPVTYIPEAMNVHDLMMKFINDGISIACVVDEYGGTAGLITLEDILEEIFGEIEDEHDNEDIIEEQINDLQYRLAGRQELSYLNEKYDNINIPEGEYHTLSGYIVMTQETIPEQGEEITIDDNSFFIENVTDKKIETVVLTVSPKQNEEEEVG